MTGSSTNETPFWIIDETATPEQRSTLEMIGGLASTDRDHFGTVVSLFSEAPEAVGNVLDYLSKHPEGMKTLEAWRHIVGQKLDGLIEFDEATEQAIGKDPYFMSTKKDFDKTNGDERLRNKLRDRRWKLFAERAA